ncbi:MAG: hypothetical protein E7596_01905 [Ruminococcaceae bacterium]|nr:hypothetical protein [Oscillospiraceae bacterium]
MFTKYTDIDLPKNYSGSRFKQAIADTKMKTHRAQQVPPNATAIKTAVSPSFQDIIDKTAKASEPTNELSLNADAVAEVQEAPNENDYSEDALSDKETQIEAFAQQNERNDSDLFSLFKSSGLGKLLDNKSRDDFLLIALIVLMASDGAGDNLDAIILLALLLLYS